MRSKIFCLSIVLLLGAPAVICQAAEPNQGTLKAFPAPPAGPNSPAGTPAPPATPSLNPITAVKAMNQSIRAGDQQTRAAIESMNRAESKASSAPAPRPGGGKVIYGDIIIYK